MSCLKCADLYFERIFDSDSGTLMFLQRSFKSIPVQNAPSPPRGALLNLYVLKCPHSVSTLRRSFESILVQIPRPYPEKQ